MNELQIATCSQEADQIGRYTFAADKEYVEENFGKWSDPVRHMFTRDERGRLQLVFCRLDAFSTVTPDGAM